MSLIDNIIKSMTKRFKKLIDNRNCNKAPILEHGYSKRLSKR